MKHMEMLGPQSFHLVVHYKEAVRERERMNLFMSYWALEETTRLRTLRQFLYRAAEDDFGSAEREAALLLRQLLEKFPSSVEVTDSLSALRDHNRKSLRSTDAQLDLLKDHIEQTILPPAESELHSNSDAA